MARFRVKRDSVQKVSNNLQEYKKRKIRHFEMALAVWGDGTVAEVQQMLLKIGAFDQGLLAAATERSNPEWQGSKVRLFVRNGLEYASIIEWGRRAGSGKPPPLLAIAAWASRKGIVNLPRNISFGGEWSDKWAAAGAIVRNMKKGRGSSADHKKPLDPVIRDLLIIRLIAKKIFEKGIRGRHPFTIAFERRMRVLRKEVRDTLALLTK